MLLEQGPVVKSPHRDKASDKAIYQIKPCVLRMHARPRRSRLRFTFYVFALAMRIAFGRAGHARGARHAQGRRRVLRRGAAPA